MYTDLCCIQLSSSKFKLAYLHTLTGPVRTAAWNEQSPVVVETVTKSSTIRTFAAAQPWHDSDASKVKSKGAGLQKAEVNKDATVSIDTSGAGL